MSSDCCAWILSSQVVRIIIITITYPKESERSSVIQGDWPGHWPSDGTQQFWFDEPTLKSQGLLLHTMNWSRHICTLPLEREIFSCKDLACTWEEKSNFMGGTCHSHSHSLQISPQTDRARERRGKLKESKSYLFFLCLCQLKFWLFLILLDSSKKGVARYAQYCSESHPMSEETLCRKQIRYP